MADIHATPAFETTTPNPQSLTPILTSRLRLREFTEADLDALSLLNADAASMRYVGSGQTLDRAATWRQIAVILGHQQLRGHSILAIEDRATGELLGRTGPWFPLGWPMLEVGWFVDPARRGRGIATEVGRACIDWSYENLGVDTVCSLIHADNLPSARVAEKLGAKIENQVTIGGVTANVWIHRKSGASQPRNPALAPPANNPTHATPVLETARLRLRPFRETDLEDVARLYADPAVMRYIGSEGKTLSRELAWREIACFLGHAQLRGYTTWAIEERETGRYVGECGPWFPEGWPMLEVGWLIDPACQGRGYATEAGRAVLDWCFANLGVQEVCSLIRPENEASIRVAQKLGAKLERGRTTFSPATELWLHRA